MLPKSIFFVVIFFLLNQTAFAQFNANLKYGTVKDIDGNTYKTIKIGKQTWMAENLRTTKYRNATPIKNITDDDEWGEDETGAWCYYENDESYNNPHGKLYSWYAVKNSNQICPKGWHVPTDTEWSTLINYLDPEANGGEDDNIVGGKMKTAGTEYWQRPNTDATNSSGWSGLPGGFRYSDGAFYSIGEYGLWWSSTKGYADYPRTRYLYYYFGNVSSYLNNKNSGLSVRCLRD